MVLQKAVFLASFVAATVLGQRFAIADTIGTPNHHYTLTCPPAWKEYPRGAAEEKADPRGVIEHVLRPEGAPVIPTLSVLYDDNAAVVADPTAFALGLQVGAQRAAQGAAVDAHASLDVNSLQVQLDTITSRAGVAPVRSRTVYVLGRHAIVGIMMTDTSADFDAHLPILNDAVKSMKFDPGYESLSPRQAAEAPASREIASADGHYRFNLPMAWTRFKPEPDSGTSPEKLQHVLHPSDDASIKIPTIVISFENSFVGNPEEFYRGLKARDGSGSRPDVKIVRTETTYDPATHRITTIMEIDLPDLPRVYSRSVRIFARKGFADLQFVDRSGNRPLHEPAFDALLDTFMFDSAFAYPDPATHPAARPAAIAPHISRKVGFLVFLITSICAALFVALLVIVGIVLLLRRRGRSRVG